MGGRRVEKSLQTLQGFLFFSETSHCTPSSKPILVRGGYWHCSKFILVCSVKLVKLCLVRDHYSIAKMLWYWDKFKLFKFVNAADFCLLFKPFLSLSFPGLSLVLYCSDLLSMISLIFSSVVLLLSGLPVVTVATSKKGGTRQLDSIGCHGTVCVLNRPDLFVVVSLLQWLHYEWWIVLVASCLTGRHQVEICTHTHTQKNWLNAPHF